MFIISAQIEFYVSTGIESQEVSIKFASGDFTSKLNLHYSPPTWPFWKKSK
jgi:hypothetical protein